MSVVGLRTKGDSWSDGVCKVYWTKHITQVICEPMLSKRNLYPPISRRDADYSFSKLLVDILAYCDGSEDLLQIAER